MERTKEQILENTCYHCSKTTKDLSPDGLCAECEDEDAYEREAKALSLFDPSDYLYEQQRDMKEGI